MQISRVRDIRRIGLLAAALGAWAIVAACSSSGGKRTGDAAAPQDGFALDFRFGDLPPGCPPTAGNEKGVGAPCTKGARSCPTNMICACDEFNGLVPPEDTPCFCTLPILGRVCSDPALAGYCGQGASCCGYMTFGAICVPDICLDAMMCPAL